ncbi:ATP-binding protein [Actinomadura rubrisoli]|uniref:ATP-binding protein n=1 Tax=Actinomadura rubrisoli TaxID=2530368 RepID=A0A4R5C1U5_9ACTN|nr:ATP-binding protein [Actinomadura rubrisoli]TDD92489.1 hypothetical protein E1298_10750 [Actinomadura rubrisoli]
MKPATDTVLSIPNLYFVGFHGYKENAHLARDLVGQAFEAWGMNGTPAEDDATSIVGEIAANAIEWTPGKSIGLWIHRFPTCIEFRMWDECRDLPIVRPEDSSSERGRGYLIIAALATRGFGAFRNPVGRGKIVWARLAIQS